MSSRRRCTDGVPDLPLHVYEAGLRSGRVGLVDRDGRRWPMDVPKWSGTAGKLDEPLVRRCQGPTLDVGCGPGRLTTALQQRGLETLGIDISPLAVALTRARGGTALHHDVFTDLPRGRAWAHLLLADGNVGIGGDPLRLLHRCRSLVLPTGSVLLDLAPPGTGLRTRRVRLETGEHRSDWFDWSWLGVDALAPVAAAAGLRVVSVWQAEAVPPGAGDVAGPGAGRWQAELAPTGRWDRPGCRAAADVTARP